MNKIITHHYFLLVMILIVASILRLWQLGMIPASPDWDEAALGYNAYSILETGKDEYANTLPVVLRSFDDYKPALYAYFIIPFIKILGLNLLAVRLPSALIGIATVGVTYLFVKELTRKSSIAVVSSFLLAISPWHIQFTRTAFEASIGVFFNVLMALFFLKGLRKPWFLILSTFCAGVSIYSYQSEKVFTPLVLIVLVLIYHREVLRVSFRYLVMAVVVGSIAIAPMVLYIASHSSALARATTTVSFADEKAFLRDNAKRQLIDTNNHDFLGKFVDNRRLVYLRAISTGYLAHFDLKWLFIAGDASRHHAPGMGLLYLIELPFLFLGIYYLFFTKKISLSTKLVVVGWLLLTPIPAAVGNDYPHAVRTLNFLPMIQVLIALGMIEGYSLVTTLTKRKILVRFLLGLAGVLFLINIFYYLNQYFVQLNYFYSRDWQYGYEEMAVKLNTLNKRYNRIIVSEKTPLDQSYIFVLFYTQFPPQEFQDSMQYIVDQHLDHRQFGPYLVRSITWDTDKDAKGTLLIGTPSEFPQDIRTKDAVHYLNGETAMLFVDPEDNKLTINN